MFFIFFVFHFFFWILIWGSCADKLHKSFLVLFFINFKRISYKTRFLLYYFIIIWLINLFLEKTWGHLNKRFFIFLCLGINIRDAYLDILKSFLNSVEIPLHFVMVTAALVRVASFDKLRKHLKNSALPSQGFSLKLFREQFEKGIVFDVFLVTPMTCLIVSYWWLFFLVDKLERSFYYIGFFFVFLLDVRKVHKIRFRYKIQKSIDY